MVKPKAKAKKVLKLWFGPRGQEAPQGHHGQGREGRGQEAPQGHHGQGREGLSQELPQGHLGQGRGQGDLAKPIIKKPKPVIEKPKPGIEKPKTVMEKPKSIKSKMNNPFRRNVTSDRLQQFQNLSLILMPWSSTS
ncbi:hypothetical protein SDJN03_14274, partial [Cucurbita argyrosperma subsp. sororia]